MRIVSSKVCWGDAVLLESEFAGKSLKSRRLFVNSGSESRELELQRQIFGRFSPGTHD
jgi:hypothetical protein